MNTTENKTDLKQGFKPDTQAKKLLAQYFDTCAYVYPQGVMIREKKTIKQGKYSHQIEIFHIYPCNIKIHRTNYQDSDSMPITRIVCHNPTTLLDGIKQFEYYANNASEAMKKQGITCNSITLVTLNGARHRSDEYPFLSFDYTVQTDDCVKWDRVIETEKNYGSIIEMH